MIYDRKVKESEVGSYFGTITCLKNNKTLRTVSYMLSEVDREYFELCFKLGEKAYDLQEVPVGCVFSYKGQIIGRGFNEVNKTKNPTRHAEFVAIDEANEWCQTNGKNFDEVMGETIVYVNLEPCIMCASALHQLRISKLIFGAKNPRFGGIESVASNKNYGHEHEITIISEVDKERCISLLRKFYDRENPFAPQEYRKTKEQKPEEEKNAKLFKPK